MRPIRRTLIAILLLTATAATLMRMQADAMADAMADRNLRLARAAALELGAAELARASGQTRHTESRPDERRVETVHGLLSVRVESEAVSRASERLRVTVTDDEGRVLTTHETVLTRETR